jgi:hypothetical protein
MTEYRGISGTYSDFKLVKTRSVVQVIVEFPIEEAQQVLESLGGLPMPGKEEHVSLGLRSKLLEIAEESSSDNLSAKPLDRQTVDQGRRINPSLLSLVGKQRYAEADEMEQARTRSALLPKDPLFHQWAGVFDETEAKDYIRSEIGGSRSLIATDRDAYNRFLRLEQEFLVWAGRATEMLV